MKTRRAFSLSPLAALIALSLAAPAAASAGGGQNRVEFNTDFLSPQTRAGLDVARFERGNPALPGDYRVELYLNGRALGRAHVTVRPGAEPDRPRLCMTRALLDQAGLDWERADAQARQALDDPAACVALEDVANDARAEFDSGELRLDLSLPQMALRRAPRGYVSPELWDSGVSGGLLNYTLNAYRNSAAGAATTTSTYLGLRAGINAGDWHFRHQGGESRQSGPSGSRRAYQNINTYVERDLPSITGRLTLGDGNTSGSLFNSLSFRGLQLASDDRMLPDSRRGYAPVVRGMAETNARVTIRQRGVLIYDMPVPPGPFVIDDLYPAGYGGDLEVTINEGDGRTRSFTVPYASVAQLLRPGLSRYSLTAGALRNLWLSFTPGVVEATWQRGLSNALTGYGGVQANDRYRAAQGGVALGTPLGAFSVDFTGARTQLPGRAADLSGSSARLSYSKLLQQTGSNISLAAYRFSTRGFLDMAEAMRGVDAVKRGFSADALARPRSRLSLTLSQPLGDGRGHFYLNGFTQNYWNGHAKDTQIQIGYSNRYRSLGYSLSLARLREPGSGLDNRVMLNLSLPLGQAWQTPRLSASLTHDRNGAAAQAMLSGVAGDNGQWSYNASLARDPGDAGPGATVNGQYIGARATAMAGYGKGRGYHNLSAGLSGSIVAHPGGVTLSPYPSDTVAVVAAAPEAAGAHVLGYPGVILDAGGQAVLPYLTPYRVNEVAIDPNGIAPDVELQTASQKVAPRAGAIVMLRYAAAAGRAALIDAALPDGALLPFGADVVDGDGKVVGAVGQAGRIYARLAADEASLSVRWGQAPHEQCTMRAVLPPPNPSGGIAPLKLDCLPGAAPRPPATTQEPSNEAS